MQSALLFVLILGVFIHSASALAVAVISIDLGSEWIKIGVVSPGVPMEIVLNKESKRKTPLAISFRDGERLIGEDALNVAVRFPKNAFIYFLDLVGKNVDHPIVQLYKQRFPFYDIEADEERGTVVFRLDSETTYSVEELLGMLLNECRAYAQDFTKQPISDAVIVVPAFFNQAERNAVMVAAQLVNLKVLQLMNTNTAAALNYGIFRRKDFDETAQQILLYDMGASSTTASVISYQVVKSSGESNPQLSVLGVGYDRILGGLEFQLRVRNHLAGVFNSMKLTTTDIHTNPRAMAKLFKESGRVKNVLSANPAHYAQVEGLLDDHGFKTPITREEFNHLCYDLYTRVPAPAIQALKSAQLTMDSIDQVILIGAGTRVPKVQEVLGSYLKRELGKSLNTDEAAAMGAVYKAADLSKVFKVKKFGTKDAVLVPILVDFERQIESDEGVTIKIVRRTLFSHMNPYPHKKIMTFNNLVRDFNFYIHYGQDENTDRYTIGSNITRVELTGVTDALTKNAGTESKGVKAHFNLDESGILSLNVVESYFEKKSIEEPKGILSKLISAFRNLFSSANETEPAKEKEPQNVTPDATANATEPKAIKTSSTPIDLKPLNEAKFKESAEKLNKLNEVDRLRNLRDKARNNLEGLVLETQDRIFSSEYEHMLTDEEREVIGKTCSELSDWLYDEGSDGTREIYEEKYKTLKLSTKSFNDRMREHKDRPDAPEQGYPNSTLLKSLFRIIRKFQILVSENLNKIGIFLYW